MTPNKRKDNSQIEEDKTLLKFKTLLNADMPEHSISQDIQQLKNEEEGDKIQRLIDGQNDNPRMRLKLMMAESPSENSMRSLSESEFSYFDE
jgi:hypothetical protein